MSAKIVILLASGIGAVACGVWALGPAELGLNSTPSDNYKTVQRDPSWLGYLPAETTKTSIEVTSLTKDSVDGDNTRRVDLLERDHHASVSLCFAKSEKALQASCPGARVLGKIGRPVEEPWVGQLGTSEVDFLALLNKQAPTLDEADSIKS